MDIVAFLIFFLVLAGSIFIHELGHFIAARMAKIEVEEFGFGLPPKALTLFRWQGTEFTLNWLPLGGFVRPKGENDPNVPGGLSAANPWKRLGVLFAGPLMNLLTAVVVFSLIVALTGIPIDGPVTITSVEPGSPAHWALFEEGDVLVSINGQEILQSGPARQLVFENLDKPIDVTVLRNGQQIDLQVVPSSTRGANQGALGIMMENTMRPATASEIVSRGLVLTGAQAITILSIPVLLVQGVIAPGDARMVGLVGMMDMFSQAVERDTETRQEAATASTNGQEAPLPSNYTLSLLAMLSVSLGVFNLLPIPALDGGRILFTLPEILFRRRIPYQFENVVNGVAFLLLIGLMIFVNLMDVINPANIQLP